MRRPTQDITHTERDKFSELQNSRRHFIPKTPRCYMDVANTKIRLVKTVLPVKDELKPIFPTLLKDGAEGMPNIEVVVDNENGTLLKSERPLRVSVFCQDDVIRLAACSQGARLPVDTT